MNWKESVYEYLICANIRATMSLPRTLIEVYAPIQFSNLW